MITGTYNTIVCIPGFYSFHYDRILIKGELFVDNASLFLAANTIHLENEILKKEINYDRINEFIKQVEKDLDKSATTKYW